MRLLIVNGPLLDLLGERNTKVYGTKTYKQLNKELKDFSRKNNINLKIVQSDSEYRIIKILRNAKNKYDGLIINAGAFTHYSYAIREAVEYLNIRSVEIHISDIKNRENFRNVSVFDGLINEKIIGHGTDGYKEAICLFIKEK